MMVIIQKITLSTAHSNFWPTRSTKQPQTIAMQLATKIGPGKGKTSNGCTMETLASLVSLLHRKRWPVTTKHKRK